MTKHELEKLQGIVEGKKWLLDDTDKSPVMPGNIYKMKVENGVLIVELVEKTSRYGTSSFKTTSIAGFREYQGGIHINTERGTEFWFMEDPNEKNR